MQKADQLLRDMCECADAWEQAGDQRCIFLRCYSMMSANMSDAIQTGRFADPPWVAGLMLRFADYYFDALKCYDQEPIQAPAAWQQAFGGAQQPKLHVLQNLLLGINAHINYDLPLALYDCLRHEWGSLSLAQRRQRQADHRLVNRIIAETIDAVQDAVIEPHSPAMGVVDRLFGRVDEWLLSQLITNWRSKVWKTALLLLEAPDDASREAIRQQLERQVLRRGKRLAKGLPG